MTPLSHIWIPTCTILAFWALLLVLKAVMARRTASDLASRLVAPHNLLLCVWSALMFVGAAVAMVAKYRAGGVRPLFCSTLPEDYAGAAVYWTWMYYVSKFYELLDTVLLVLRKRPTPFLHVYHHSIVLFMCHVWLTSRLEFGSMGVLANTGVHVIMYYYYYLCSVGRRPSWASYITILQIFQFMVSFLLAVPYVIYSYDEAGCQGWWGFLIALFINASFLYLFVDFYRKRYNSTNAKKRTKKA